MFYRRGDTEEPDTRELATAIGANVILTEEGDEGSLRAIPCRNGIPTVTIVMGRARRFQPALINMALAGGGERPQDVRRLPGKRAYRAQHSGSSNRSKGHQRAIGLWIRGASCKRYKHDEVDREHVSNHLNNGMRPGTVPDRSAHRRETLLSREAPSDYLNNHPSPGLSLALWRVRKRTDMAVISTASSPTRWTSANRL